MDSYGRIAQKIKEIAGANGKGALLFTAKVTEVQNETCSIKIGDLPLTEVRLKSVIDGKDERLFIRPRKGSDVLVGDMSGGDMRQLAVLSYSEIDEVDLKIGKQTLTIDKEGFVFNGGENKGMVKIEELTNKLNDLVQKFNSHTHSVATTGTAAAQTGTATATVTRANPFNVNDFENKKVKH